MDEAKEPGIGFTKIHSQCANASNAATTKYHQISLVILATLRCDSSLMPGKRFHVLGNTMHALPGEMRKPKGWWK
ncbi:hypothetical protein GR183_02430 [Stappia sp. GBMRC 2046]|uniref:Uncharacterized protein n=1 Tax=Stappia sediminis TaxID=2692190 RepID=A0A7X3S685_9HYPH|nr:hypothetical protein [Stappia sediminis]MXN63749.1 hypothetical protein [Stappia sediminis]